jgi:hypothetical protein
VKPASKTVGTIVGESCAIWDFQSATREAERLAAFVASEMKAHNLGPRDFVLLVPQKAADYAAMLQPAFAAAGIPLRNEAGQAGAMMLQELLAEGSELIVCVLRLAMTARAGRHWTECQEALGSLRGIGPDDEIEQNRFAKELDAYATRLGRDYPTPPTAQPAARKLINDVLGFIGRGRLVAAYPAYGQGIGRTRCSRQRRHTLLNRRRTGVIGPRRLIPLRGFTLSLSGSCRVRASPLRNGALFHASSVQHTRKAVVSFDATGLVINPIFLIALPGEVLLDRPWPRPHGRVFDRDNVFERSWSGACPAFDHMQILARPVIIGLRAEVCHVDDERIALPMAARVAIPLADVERQMRASVHDDVSLPSLSLAHVVEHRDAVGGLDDPAEAAAKRGNRSAAVSCTP